VGNAAQSGNVILVIVATLGSLIAMVMFNPDNPCGISESAIERSVVDPTGTHASPPLMVKAVALTDAILTVIRRTRPAIIRIL
jgi:hypothetical protein